MNRGTNESGVLVTKRSNRLIHYAAHAEPDDVIAAVTEPGEVLKTSSRAVTRRCGSFVVKRFRARHGYGLLKLNVLRIGNRTMWARATELFRRGVPIPCPTAFVERRHCGTTTAAAYVCEYLDGWVDVEQYARQMLRGGASSDAVRAYLENIADAVNKLTAAGAYHSDLSGKNIFTDSGGESIRFIDLDDVRLDTPYTRSRRFRNHVQLFDSFCDMWGHDLLEPFIERMLPSEYDSSIWHKRVVDAQRRRRARYEAQKRRRPR